MSFPLPIHIRRTEPFPSLDHTLILPLSSDAPDYVHNLEETIIPTPLQSSHWIDQRFTLDELYHALHSKKSTTPGPEYPIALSSNSQHPPSSPYVEFSMLYGQNLSFQTSGYPINSLSFPRKTLPNSKPIALADSWTFSRTRFPE